MIILADISKYAEKEDLYIAVRDSEQRVVNDDLLKTLPVTPSAYIHHNEWEIRTRNFHRFLKYIQGLKKPLSILDVGCGNGWMSAQLNRVGHSVTAVDLNMTELQQAEKVFGTNERLKWVYADIMEDTIDAVNFDVIVFGASCQYFNNITTLTKRIMPWLCKKGSIHLLDSFFYAATDIQAAHDRTAAYYNSIGHPIMSEYYFHHSISDLKKLGYKKLYPGMLSPKSHPQWWVMQS